MPRDRERGKSGVFPPTIDLPIPSSWSEIKGNKRVFLHLLAGGRAEVGFFLLICSFTVPVLTLMGGLFSRGIHCAICACLVSNFFSTTKWGVAQDRHTWMCESIVSLARNNTQAHSFSESDTSRSSDRSKSLVGHHFIFGLGTARETERYAENAMPLHNTAGWQRQGSESFYSTLRRRQHSDDPACSLGNCNVVYTVWALLLRICRGVIWGGIIVEGSTDAA
ncbi:hypothetical protein TcCL_ESM10686 [Trypanosoma cruzi]|nr:hypothetical protein TcCL_NonESM05083 [Trypanosoma cruzi]RNC52121.1 hypothetical protein TcCL_ESM10686 [Trypanosoma cruzi]